MSAPRAFCRSFAALIASMAIGGAVLAAAAPSPAAAVPSIPAQPYQRVPWWPYSTGPFYGETRSSSERSPDLLVTPVGSFRPAERLVIPAELTAAATWEPGAIRHFACQLRAEAADSHTLSRLEALGARVVAHVPVNAVIVAVDRDAHAALAGAPEVLRVEPWHPAYKLLPSIGQRSHVSKAVADAHEFLLDVQLFPGPPLATVLDEIRARGASVVSSGPEGPGWRWVQVRALPEAVIALAHLESVFVIDEVADALPLGTRTSSYVQSEAGIPGEFPYWEAGLQGDGQVIAVTDTGFSVDAADLADTRIDSGWRESTADNVLADHRKVRAYVPANEISGGQGNLLSCDKDGPSHGQMVAGIAAGNATRGCVPASADPGPTDAMPFGGGPVCRENVNATPARAFGPGFYSADAIPGYAEAADIAFDGIAKGARLLLVDAAQYDCSGNDPWTVALQPGNLTTLITQSWTGYQASIHNFSWGSLQPSTVYGTKPSQVDQAVRSNPANLVVVAAGNWGMPSPPATSALSDLAHCKNCVVAGASMGVEGVVHGYSSGGPVAGDRVPFMVLAEGFDDACRSDEIVNDQAGPATCAASQFAGTSASAATISGAAAIIREYFAEGFYPDGTDRNDRNAEDKVPWVSGRLLRAILAAGTAPVTAAVQGSTQFKTVPKDRFNNVTGFGQFFLNRALPLAAQTDETANGIIVHDHEVNASCASLRGVSGLPGLSPCIGTASQSAEFTVAGGDEDLAVVLTWDDGSTSGSLIDDLELTLTYCGADGLCSTEQDNIVWYGNMFSENRDGSSDCDTVEAALFVNGGCDGYWYSMSDTQAPANLSLYRDHRHNVEAVFVPDADTAPDVSRDGTADMIHLAPGGSGGCRYGGTCARPGKWKITVARSAGVGSIPYSIAIVGPVAGSSNATFSDNPVACNGDVHVYVTETNDPFDAACNATACPPEAISARTTVSVYGGTASSPVLFDEIAGLEFQPEFAGSRRFRTVRPVALAPLATGYPFDSILSIADAYRLEVRYTDVDANGTARVRVGEAMADCSPRIDLVPIVQEGADALFSLSPGCDGDLYLDAEETFTLTVQAYNNSPRELVDAVATLEVHEVDPSLLLPCNHIEISTPVVALGTVAPYGMQKVSFGLRALTPPALHRVRFRLCISAPKSGLETASCLRFEMLAQADLEKKRFITDCPTGCTLQYDLNADERLDASIPPNPFDPADRFHRGRNEVDVMYENLTTTAYGGGNPGFNGPWDFDSNDEGFRSGVTKQSKLNSQTASITNWGEDTNWNGVLDAGEDVNSNAKFDQNWSTAGGCGWMSKGSTATTGGVWHTGTISAWTSAHATTMCGTGTVRFNDGVCEQYDAMNVTGGTSYWFETLRTPIVRPVHVDPDENGFSWQTRILDWSWNMQLDVADEAAAVTMEVDLDVNDAERSVLGDEFVQRVISGPTGLVTGGAAARFGGYFAFAPTVHDSADPNYGDGVNGTIQGNRSGRRGCYFNDLNRESAAHTRTTVRLPRPADDDCDNDVSLGPNGCPGQCGIDDDGNGLVDDFLEVCPCTRCSSTSPRAGKPCVSHGWCNPDGLSGTSAPRCVPSTSASGVPTPYGDDVCGDGVTDETLSAQFGTSPTLRQTRNADLNMGNGVGDRGPVTGNTEFTQLEDLYGPVGSGGWAAELGFVVVEMRPGSPVQERYGTAVDDMVFEWEESHPIANSVSSACTGGPAQTNGACASVVFVTGRSFGGEYEFPVTVVDAFPGVYDPVTGAGNLGECTTGGAPGILVRAFSEADPVGESVCLPRRTADRAEFVGWVRTTTTIARAGDGYVFVGAGGLAEPRVYVMYLDRFDGVHGWSKGADNQPGIAGLDDDADGTVDNASELCSSSTTARPGGSPHLPGTPAAFSDDSCGCPSNPVIASASVVLDTADLLVEGVALDDGDGTVNGDNDGFADPNETVGVDLYVRNMSDFPLENVELTLSTASPLVACVFDDRIVIPRLERKGDPGHGDKVNTATLGDHARFVAAAASRVAATDLFESRWSVAVRAVGKAEGVAAARLPVDVPIYGTTYPQGFAITHNLDRLTPAPARIVDFFDDMESYDNDAGAICTPNTGATRCTTAPYVKRWTGDDEAEKRGTRCQINNPGNLYGNNTRPMDYCELSLGLDPTENYWHLERPGIPTGTLCGRTDGCRSPRAYSGTRSLGSSENLSAYALEGEQITSPNGRMYWLKTRDAVRLGTDEVLKGDAVNRTPAACNVPPCVNQSPVLEFQTQLSITDSRTFDASTSYASDVASVYACVDENGNNDCDTLEDGNKTGSESWEILHAFFNPESWLRLANPISCMFDPSDDGSTEALFWPNSVTRGPSSTCNPQPVDSCLGMTVDATGASLAEIQAGGENVYLDPRCFPEAGDLVGASMGSYGPGRWVTKRYDLSRFRGQSVLFRWHVSPGGTALDSCVAAGGRCANVDDGWYIDDIRVYGRASGVSLTVENTLFNPPPSLCALSPAEGPQARLAVLPYPAVSRDLKRKPALACTDLDLDSCDYDDDGTIDAPGSTTESPVLRHPFIFDASFSTVTRCARGGLEYRFEREFWGQTEVLRDWGLDPTIISDPELSALYTVRARCSSDPTTTSTASSYVHVPLPGQSPTPPPPLAARRGSGKSVGVVDLSWQGIGPFDVVTGDIGDVLEGAGLHGGNFSAAKVVACGTDARSISHPAQTAPGHVTYYLVRESGGAIGWNDTEQVGDRNRTLTACAP